MELKKLKLIVEKLQRSKLLTGMSYDVLTTFIQQEEKAVDSQQSKIFKTLSWNGQWIDSTMLGKGLYHCEIPRIYEHDTTIESLISSAKSINDSTGGTLLNDQYFENLKQCTLIDVQIKTLQTSNTELNSTNQCIAYTHSEKTQNNNVISIDKFNSDLVEYVEYVKSMQETDNSIKIKSFKEKYGYEIVFNDDVNHTFILVEKP